MKKASWKISHCVAIGCISLLYIFSQLAACKTAEVKPNLDLNFIPTTTEADKAFTDIFKKLDGKWEGYFFTIPGRKGFDYTQINQNNYQDFNPTDSIWVQQHYTSVNPYFQRVTILDRYITRSGLIKNLPSKGVNKVENGRLFCLVNKTNEQVVHNGKKIDEQTIKWYRTTADIKLEEFLEEVQDSAYIIKGTGTYGQDDSNKLFFYANYKRVE